MNTQKDPFLQKIQCFLQLGLISEFCNRASSFCLEGHQQYLQGFWWEQGLLLSLALLMVTVTAA